MRIQLLALSLSLTSLATASPQQTAQPRTFSAAEWSAKTGPDQPQAWALSQSFRAWFPGGLVIGDPDGLDGDKFSAVMLRTSAEVITALNTSPTAGATTLDSDLIGVNGLVLGNLGRQLLAAKLNIAYDAVSTKTDLESYAYGVKAPAALRGWRVARTIKIADRAYSGEYGRPAGSSANEKNLVDVDGDGKAELSLGDLAQALLEFNMSFNTGSKQKAMVFAQGSKHPDAVAVGTTVPAKDESAPVGPVVVPGAGAGGTGATKPETVPDVKPIPEVKPAPDVKTVPGVTPTVIPAGSEATPANAAIEARYKAEITKLQGELEKSNAERERALAMVERQKKDNERLTAALAKAERQEKRAEKDAKELEKVTLELERVTKENERMTEVLGKSARQTEMDAKSVERLTKENERLQKALDKIERQAEKDAEKAAKDAEKDDGKKDKKDDGKKDDGKSRDGGGN